VHSLLGVDSSEDNMSFKLMARRIVMAFVLGGYSVLGVGMSREKIESLMQAMNRSNIELSISDAVDGDPEDDFTDSGEDVH
jgi:hypothetical protein